MKRPLSNPLLSLLAVIISLMTLAMGETKVGGIVDLAHEFSFYGDGRFKKQYLPDEHVVTSWGNLYDMDAANANLLVLLGCYPKVSYTARDIAFINNFLQSGGAVLIMGSHGDNPQNKLAVQMGAFFADKAVPPLKATAQLGDNMTIEGSGGSYMKLKSPAEWTILVQDSSDRPVLALKSVGKGKLLVGARSLAGNRPNASDNINAEWWTPLLKKSVQGKPLTNPRELRGKGLTNQGNVKTVGGLVYHFSDYLKPTFKAMVNIQARCRPAIEKRMGVPLSDGMATQIGLLATDGGGFSSGHNIGLSVFWGGFPEREDNMIEFITHETVHSWVLPHPEVWNEPIATYVGNLIMQDMGHADEGRKRISNTINRAMKIDSTMTRYDLSGRSTASDARELNDGERNNIHWGKSYWVLEKMTEYDPKFLAKYFQTKRKYVPAKLDGKYDLNLTVAVISKALGRNMFPWFNKHGMPVDPSAVGIDELKIK